jgi:hypothetical protein
MALANLLPASDGLQAEAVLVHRPDLALGLGVITTNLADGGRELPFFKASWACSSAW